jgi:threonyl-tRNA synthetase
MLRILVHEGPTPTLLGVQLPSEEGDACRRAVPYHKEAKLEVVLVCLTSFEKHDEGRIEELVKAYSDNVKIDSYRLGAKRVLLYPYAHLSKNLGSQRQAKEFIKRPHEHLQQHGYEDHRSPFGWYKAFTLTCIDHPLAEAYRKY